MLREFFDHSAPLGEGNHHSAPLGEGNDHCAPLDDGARRAEGGAAV